MMRSNYSKSRQLPLKLYFRKKKPPSVRKHEISIFLLAACVNSFVDSVPYKYLLYLWSLIWSKRVCGSWYLTIWLKITVHSSVLDFQTVIFRTDFRKWFFGTLFLNSPFQNHFVSVLLQQNQALWNQSFKRNWMYITS